MKKYLKKEYLPILALLVGALCLGLQILLLGTADHLGLVERGSWLHIAAWVLLLAFALVAALEVRKLEGSNRHGENFPASLPGAAASVLLAAGIGLTLVLRSTPQGLLGYLWLGFGIVSVPALIFTGLCRWRGRRPSFWSHGAVCLFFGAHLVRSCQSWSSEPQVSTYVFTLLACAGLMLTAYHRAAFDAGIGRRRMQMFIGLVTVAACLAGLPGSGFELLYAPGCLWAVTNLCAMTPHRRRRRPDFPEEEPAQEDGPC